MGGRRTGGMPRNRYRYIGVERDEDTGLCMTGPRTYDPVCGRFLQEDPGRDRREMTPVSVCSGESPWPERRVRHCIGTRQAAASGVTAGATAVGAGSALAVAPFLLLSGDNPEIRARQGQPVEHVSEDDPAARPENRPPHPGARSSWAAPNPGRCREPGHQHAGRALASASRPCSPTCRGGCCGPRDARHAHGRGGVLAENLPQAGPTEMAAGLVLLGEVQLVPTIHRRGSVRSSHPAASEKSIS